MTEAAPAPSVRREAVIALLVSPLRRFLVLHRTPQDRTWPNVWCLPGGKRDPGESLQEALEREVGEETGKRLAITNTTPILERNITAPSGRNFTLSVCQHLTEEFEVVLSDEHDESRWVTVEEAAGMTLAPIARELIEGWTPGLRTPSQRSPKGGEEDVPCRPERVGTRSACAFPPRPW